MQAPATSSLRVVVIELVNSEPHAGRAERIQAHEPIELRIDHTILH